MCGIFSLLLSKKAPKSVEDILLAWLQALEYRWYDSAGIALQRNGWIDVYKSIGKVDKLAELVHEAKASGKEYTCGIGHTRWATHGGVTLANTHPHSNSDTTLFVVHNGIIENYHELLAELPKWEILQGQTDTEIFVKTLTLTPGNTLLDKMRNLLPRLHGTFAFVIMSKDSPNELIGVKSGSPLLFARGKHGEMYLSSDSNALKDFNGTLYDLEDGDMIHITETQFTIENSGRPVTRKNIKYESVIHMAEKNWYEHYMLKEIHESPSVIEKSIQDRVQLREGTILAKSLLAIRDIPFERVEFIGSGTSYHAGLLASYWIEQLSELDTRCSVASEFFEKLPRIEKTTLFVLVSQSGETADLIWPLKYLEANGANTFGIVNVENSTIAKLSKNGLFARAGKEISVASTKAFIAQITALLIMSLFFSIQSSSDFKRYRDIFQGLEDLPALAQEVFKLEAQIAQIWKELSNYRHLFFLGRGANVAIAQESALKFKEVTYIHASALPIWELKHGTLALIDAYCPSIVFIPSDANFEKNRSAIREIQARNGKICAISEVPLDDVDWNIVIPRWQPIFYGFLAAITGQLLAYYAAKALGNEIDTPRNLAKSVTVE
jgi:glutamine---fructose-6-phosphate transaminase (isomerizing)